MIKTYRQTKSLKASISDQKGEYMPSSWLPLYGHFTTTFTVGGRLISATFEPLRLLWHLLIQYYTRRQKNHETHWAIRVSHGFLGLRLNFFTAYPSSRLQFYSHHALAGRFVCHRWWYVIAHLWWPDVPWKNTHYSHHRTYSRRLHCGEKPGCFETSNHSLSHELGSKWASEWTNERSEACKRCK